MNVYDISRKRVKDAKQEQAIERALAALEAIYDALDALPVEETPHYYDEGLNIEEAVSDAITAISWARS